MHQHRLETDRNRTLSWLCRGLSPILATAVFWLATPHSFAQGEEFQNCHDEFLELWVDPEFGADPAACVFDPCTEAGSQNQCGPGGVACRLDALARAGDPFQPYLTLNAAIRAAWLGICPTSGSGFSQALVHANPGIYSPETNGELLPVIMRSGVHVQGVGAKETIIRGARNPLPCFQPYIPWNPDGPTGLQPGRSFQEILVDFTFTEPSGPCIDAFTFQGGDVQVYEESDQTDKCGCVSNCVFDMRDHWTDEVDGTWIIDGPLFGVLAVNIYLGEGSVDYLDTELKVINNTFIQGWQARDAGGLEFFTELSLPENVAICNTNDPQDDPNQTQRGVGNLSVQNNLIRSLTEAPRTALLGIDRGDAHVSIGTQPGPTNAFSHGLFGNASVGNVFFSAIDPLAGPPLPKVDLLPDGPVDPAFVGEMLNNQFGPTQSFHVRDWRLLPTSALVDEGSAPDDSVPDCQDGDLQAVNGTLYTAFGRERIFDFDGDVHGNPRIRGLDVDIGYDETDVLCVAGSYGNDTKSHNLTWTATLPAGQRKRTYIFPDLNPAGAASFTLIARAVPFAAPAWTNMPGTLPFPVRTNFMGSFVGLRWLAPGFLLVGPFSATRTSYMNPIDGTPHVFHVFRANHDELMDAFPAGPRGDVQYFSEQAGYFPGDPVPPVLSSLQSEYL